MDGATRENGQPENFGADLLKGTQQTQSHWWQRRVQGRIFQIPSAWFPSAHLGDGNLRFLM